MAILLSFAPAVELITTGVVDPRLLLSKPLPLAEFGEALRRVRAGQGIKWHIRPPAVTRGPALPAVSRDSGPLCTSGCTQRSTIFTVHSGGGGAGDRGRW